MNGNAMSGHGVDASQLKLRLPRDSTAGQEGICEREGS